MTKWIKLILYVEINLYTPLGKLDERACVWDKFNSVTFLSFSLFSKCIWRSLSKYGLILMFIIIIEISRAASFCKIMILVAYGFWIGAYDDEEAAARAYDLAALKYWGPGTLINFPVS